MKTIKILILGFGLFSALTAQNKPTNSWGIDILFSMNGFGLGTFYKHEYTDELAGFADFSIAESKDDQEVEYVDYYGNTYSPGKVNRFLVMPLFIGVQKRLFKNDILDNFRPYVGGALGPTMIYVFPYNYEYFNAIGKGRPKCTFGGYLVLGSYFGSDRSNILGVNFRYYFIPYPGGIVSMEQNSTIIKKNQFGGFTLSLSFGAGW